MAVKKEWNTDACCNMDEPQEWAKWNKPVIEHILYDSTDIRWPGKVNVQKHSVNFQKIVN